MTSSIDAPWILPLATTAGGFIFGNLLSRDALDTGKAIGLLILLT